MNEMRILIIINIVTLAAVIVLYIIQQLSHFPKHKKKHIFVSYSHEKGFGSCDISLNDGIRSYDDISKIIKMLEELPDNSDVAILNWKEYDK